MPDATEVAARGYVMEEFLASGTARRLTMANNSAIDGQWEVGDGAGQTTPFTTRLVVIRPRGAAEFNGVVVVNWQNVTAGVDVGRPTGREVWRGYAWVGVTAQEGRPDGPGRNRGPAGVGP